MNYYQQPFQQPTLNGQIVDGIETARAYNVPIGSYAILPLGDLSKIYVKQWQNNGMTRIDEYQKVVIEETPQTDILQDIYNSIQELSSLLKKPTTISRAKKKEEFVNE